jgi:formate dehydrogenase iron-sulfur subunit
VRPYHAAVSLAVGLLALMASVFHLGRPQYAFRAIVGIRTSWLSREILAFGAFAGLAALHAGLFWARGLGAPWSAALAEAGAAVKGLGLHQLLGGLVAASGAAGVGCSVMLYQATAREWWSGGRTSFRFFGTAAVLGLATMLMTIVVFSAPIGTSAPPNLLRTIGFIARLLAACGAAKLVWELGIFHHLRNKQLGPMKRTALLLSGELRVEMMLRVGLGFAGGVIAPLVINGLAQTSTRPVGALVTLSLFTWLALLGAELIERALFFRASCAPRMPGGVG